MNRAAARRRGKRREAERKAAFAAKALARDQDKMWKRLTDTDRSPKIGYRGEASLDYGTFYCPYIPIMRPGSFMPGDTTA